MATKSDMDKATEPGHLTVNTTELPSHNGTALSPSTSVNSTEKTLHETSVELARNSGLSTPSSARHLNPFDTDIERGQSADNLNRKSTQFTGRTLHDPNCSVWPGQNHWKQKAKAAKINNRSCQPQWMAKLSRRNRLIVKLLIAALVIGVAVGVGFGISKPLGAGIWKSPDS
ncbi:hypothetical protein PFICI_07878 [Pestalotiopsis fici W106-1]|uniref:Uncharacterized protein n=1 Tax=Pestalotiopsis fici (strain W106-1 / CGMCC3.15140) TaxID=1229662 RepID=W3X2W7_PESFW|nr:uncharacterized protein PFICI_07878 [Pestalotiopsis fici W106-1]ETS80349.1 hypothetical protein PFICI_07878 [Pestalotiopsis fici W106-1]